MSRSVPYAIRFVPRCFLVPALCLCLCSSPLLADGDHLIGVIVARYEVTVAAEISGRLAAVHVDLGDRVAADAIIAQLDTDALDQDLRIQRADHLAAQAKYEIAALNRDAARQRLDRRTASPDAWAAEEIEAARLDAGLAEAEVKIARSQVERAEAAVHQLELKRTAAAVRAPFAGRVAQRYQDAGTFVQAGTPLVRLISSEDLLVRFTIAEERVMEVAPGDTVTVEIPGMDLTLTGSVRNVSPEVDAAMRRLTLEADLVVPAVHVPHIKSGMSARVFLSPTG